MNRQHDEISVLHGVPQSLMERFDPRLRTLALVLVALAAVTAQHFSTLVALLLVAVSCPILAGISPLAAVRRCLPLLAFSALLLVILPLSVPGGRGLAWPGGLFFSPPGFLQALAIALRAHAIFLAALGLVGTLELPVLAHVLAHFRIPRKLVTVFMFAIRYLHVLRDEYHRLHRAMQMRAFRPRWNRATYRAYGYLVGMLLVRSLARSERIVAAMRCRGFKGQFFLLEHFHFTAWDVFMSLLLLVGVATFVAWELLI